MDHVSCQKLVFRPWESPRPIDNDLYGSEITIGVDTALNIALESIDRLKSLPLHTEERFRLR